MVPNGWELRELKELTTIYDGTHATPKYVESGVPFYSVEHLTKGDFSKTKFITEEVFDKENKRVKLERHDILMTRIGDIGTAVHLDWDVRASFYVSLALLKATSNFDSSFMTQYINSSEFHRELWKRIIHVAFPKKINLGEIGKCHVCLPPLPEQRKIAKILSTWDKAISTTERLIDNSKQQKKALMQQLLTGKKRLVDDSGKPFEGEWEEITLERLAKYRRGSFPQPYGNPEWVDEVNGYPFIQVYDIDKNMKLKPDTKIKISDAAIGKSVFIPKETVIVSLQGSIGRVAITQYDAYVDRTVLLFQEFIVPMEKVFFAFIIQELFEIEKTKAPGGTIKTITKEVLSNFKVHIPTITEQQKIASVLINADQEIELLEQQLVDLKQEKKALMQQLLTGKRRVKVDNTEAA